MSSGHWKRARRAGKECCCWACREGEMMVTTRQYLTTELCLTPCSQVQRLETSRVIPTPSLAHESKAEYLLCSLQCGLQGCLLSFFNGHLSPDQSHEVVLYLAVSTTHVCSFSRLKNRLLIEAGKQFLWMFKKRQSNYDFWLFSSSPYFICKVSFSLVLCFQECLPFSSDTLQLLAVFAFFFSAYILI